MTRGHGYLQVDLSILERVLKENLRDMEQFAGDVEAYIAQIDAAPR
jgi:uncharacterized protein YutE (UPF0331/DUF86 family)